MKYRTQFERPPRERFQSNPGEVEYYDYIADEDGHPVANKIHNRVDEIQSHRQSCDLRILLQRYAMGDESALNQRTGTYGDFTNAPSSFAEFVDGFKQLESDFYKLPDDFRDLFGNSTVEYWQSLGSEDFAKKVDAYFAKKSGRSGNGSTGSTAAVNSNNTGGTVNESQSE